MAGSKIPCLPGVIALHLMDYRLQEFFNEPLASFAT
jgi:hypothetical protein